MKTITLLAWVILLAGCAQSFYRGANRGLASMAADEFDMNPAHYQVECGALLPGSEYFQLSIPPGATEAEIVRNNPRKAFDRKARRQRYPVRLVGTGDSFLFTGENFELRLLKSDYTLNGEGNWVVRARLKAEFQGKPVGVDSPSCTLVETKL